MLLLLLSAPFASRAELLVRVADGTGSAMPDAQVSVFFQKNYSQNLLDGVAEGFTDSLGQWRGAIEFDGGNTTAHYAFIQINSPYWASPRQQVRLPASGDELLEIAFSSPILLSTSRIRLIGADGSPITGAQVTLVRPHFSTKLTDFTGAAQFGTPQGQKVQGFVFSGGQAQEFSFTPAANMEITTHDVRLPFLTPFDSDGKTYSIAAQAIGRDGKPIENRGFQISPPFPPITVISDTSGYVRLNGVPYRLVNISFDINGYFEPVQLDLSSEINEIIEPSIMKITPPEALSLGEGCYRVQLDVRDSRPDSQASVSAQESENAAKVFFVIDQTRPSGNNSVAFYRVICVQDDSSFEITASNNYENMTVSVSLKKYTPPATPQEDMPISMPSEDLPQTPQDDHRLEIVVLLMLLLGALMFTYLAYHFKQIALYLWQAITRFMHVSYKGFRGGKTVIYEKKTEGGVPSQAQPKIGSYSHGPESAPPPPSATDIPQDEKPPDSKPMLP